jgi:hypothetical protein
MMNRNELERAWPAAEPPSGFPDRVLDRMQRGSALPEPAPRRVSWMASLMAHPVRWLAPPALVLALVGVFLLWLTWPVRDGDVLAAEPRVVSIGERVVAEMSSGAHIRWSGDGFGDGSGGEVQQDRGEVMYRVVPGTPFRVQTPQGNVAVLGTVFRVRVVDPNEAGGEPMKRKWAIAGASATLGALLWVSVDRGSVRLSKGEEELVLAAGQSGSIGSDGIPRLEPGSPIPAADAQVAADGDAERTRARQVADAVRRHAARRRVAKQAASVAAKQPASDQPPSAPTAPPMAFGPHTGSGGSTTETPPPTADDARRREYIRRTMREQYFPVARDCYQELLERQPTAGGRVVLEFAIVGDGDAGVVDRVEQRDDETTIDDPEFTLCMRESLYTAVFEPPPPGASETTVVYPVILAPE